MTALCHVLREDVNLAEAIPAAIRERAIADCTTIAFEIPRGRWSEHEQPMVPDGIGLLVLRGLLIRHVGISSGYGAELLGEGDLLRPWTGEDSLAGLPRTTAWNVLERTRIAVLDRRVAHRFARYPDLTGRLVARALERSRNLAVNMAIVHQPRIQTRVHMVLWHLADRWGYVRPDGIVLPLRLTHSVLAELVAARRPSVSVALGELARRQVVSRLEGGWLIAPDPPPGLDALRGRSSTPVLT